MHAGPSSMGVNIKKGGRKSREAKQDIPVRLTLL